MDGLTIMVVIALIGILAIWCNGDDHGGKSP
jgi:hypothetical protein